VIAGVIGTRGATVDIRRLGGAPCRATTVKFSPSWKLRLRRTKGDADDYTVVGGNEFEISGLSPGEHTVNVTLQHADHSPAGAEDEVEVTVGGAGGRSEPSDETPDDGGFDY